MSERVADGVVWKSGSTPTRWFSRPRSLASRPGMGFVPVLGRRLGVDVVNLGFSGNGKADLEVADLIAEIDAACYVNDCVANLNQAEAEARDAAFHERLRARHPAAPILLLTSISPTWDSSGWPTVSRPC